MYLHAINPIAVVEMDFEKGLKIINFLTIHFACKNMDFLSYILSLSVYSFLKIFIQKLLSKP